MYKAVHSFTEPKTTGETEQNESQPQGLSNTAV